MDAVRDWVGDFEIGKGRPYADAAVFGCSWDETQDELSAHVRGTRVRPYQVWISIGRPEDTSTKSKVLRARCSCPVGEAGTCKHVAAVLLAYVEDPKRFPAVGRLEENLFELKAEQLVALVDLFLQYAPELKPLLAIPLPGQVSEPVSPDVFRRLASEAIQSARLDDRGEDEALDALWPLFWLGDEYLAKHNQQAAEALTEGLARAFIAARLDLTRLQETLAEWNTCQAVWARLGLDAPPESPPVEPPF
jgi:hypothetical protein